MANSDNKEDVVAEVAGVVEELKNLGPLPDEMSDGSDEVFVCFGDVYSDIKITENRNDNPQTFTEAKEKVLVNGRNRRRSDVIDSLGDATDKRLQRSAPISHRLSSETDQGYSSSYHTPPRTPRPRDNATDSKPFSEEGFELYSKKIQATMSVDRDAFAYNMNHARRGRAVIFNNDTFDNPDVKSRAGSEIDVAYLTKTLAELQFEVVVHNNLQVHELTKVIAALTSEDHSDADCLFVAVLTHGEPNGFLHARDAYYKVEKLWLSFTADKCLTLAGKPKLFFIQACRGEKLDLGVQMVSQRRSTSETDSGDMAYKIPQFGDLLISYSAMEGHCSWRSVDEGTWYIQSLAHELQERGETDNILNIMTRVQRRVALCYESQVADVPWMHQTKQCPVYHSTLLRDLVFTPKNSG